MAKNRGLWADLQRELARHQRQQQQALRMEAQVAARARRDYEQAARAAARQATADGKERKRLYSEARKAEAGSMAAERRDRITQLDSVLPAGIRQRPLVTFASPKHAPRYPPFDAGGPVRPFAADTRLGAVRSSSAERSGEVVGWRGAVSARGGGSAGDL